jgi:hypothetical protein
MNLQEKEIEMLLSGRAFEKMFWILRGKSIRDYTHSRSNSLMLRGKNTWQDRSSKMLNFLLL